MYITAQRVVRAGSANGGINVFRYAHVDAAWDMPPPSIPDVDPGALVSHSISIPPGGNRVRSYFDIVAADEVDWGQIRVGMMAFVGANQRRALPWSGHAGRCYFRLGMEDVLARDWARELAALYRAAQALALASP